MSWLSAVPIISDLIDRVVPDVNARKEAKEELERLEQKGELSLILGQLEINKQEAAHTSMFVAGWRPFVGWTCGIALFYQFIIFPFVLLFHPTAVTIEVQALYPILLGMLGLGGMRTYEKYRGVSREK